MSEKVFLLPDLGEGLAGADVLEWLVAPGDEVVVDQPIATVETAKASVELPCPYAGRVVTLHGDVGATVAVGAPFVTIEVTGAASEEVAPNGRPVEEYREEERAGSGNVLIGYGTSEGPRRRRRRAGSTAPVPPPTETPARPVQPPAEPLPVPDDVPSRPGAAVRVISPLVRALAKEHGIDLRSVQPTAPGGVIRRCDVLAAVESTGRTPAPSDTGGPAAQGDRRIPLTGVRGVMATRLATSRREIPDATTWVDVDATDFLEARRVLAAARPDARIGVLALLARVAVAGLERYPELNSTVDMAANEVVVRGDINLGFAAQSPRGLVVPVVHGAGRMTLEELSHALRDLTAKAMEGTLTPAEMTGGTFTLNNYGGYGVDGSTPIINHPEAAMLGVGRFVEKPWVVDHALAVRHVGTIGLSFDHRVCDGGTAGGFLRFVADCVERPLTLLLDR